MEFLRRLASNHKVIRWGLLALMVLYVEVSFTETARAAPGCKDLFSIGHVSSPQHSAAESLVGLIRLALGSGAGLEPSFATHLQSLLDSPLPINPFLNLSSPMALALAKKAESVLDNIQGLEWRWVQDQVSFVAARGHQESSIRMKDADQTSGVNGFHFVSNHDLSKALYGNASFAPALSKKTYVGRADGYHIFSSAPKAGSNPVLDLFIVTQPQGEAGPTIRRVVPPDTNQFRNSKTESEADFRGYHGPVLVLKGKLYAIVKDAKDQSDVLVRIDVKTGSVAERIEIPEKGRIQIWSLDAESIVGVNFKRPFPWTSPPTARKFYRFDVASNQFVATGLDIGFLAAERVHAVASRARPLLFIVEPSAGFFTDGEELLQSASFQDEGKGPTPASPRDAYREDQRPLLDAVWDKDQLAVSKLVRNQQDRYLSIEVHVLETPISHSDARAKNSSPKPLVRHLQLPISENISGFPLELGVIGLPETESNLVYFWGARQLYRAWIVDRKTLAFVPIDIRTPNTIPDLERADRWVPNDYSIRKQHTFTPDKDLVLSFMFEAAHSPVSWRLNLRTGISPDLAFEGPEFLEVPTDKPIAGIAFSEDVRSIAVLVAPSGLWLGRNHRISRERGE